MRSSCVDDVVCVGVSRWPALARVSIATTLALFLAALMLVPEAEAARRKKRPGKAYSPPYASIVYDVNSGKILQDTHANALRHPASVTKVMTLYMLFEQLERGRFTLNSELRVSAEAARQAPSKLGLRVGETISVEDAIKALVTKSANDASVVVAEAIGGTHERFAQMMTTKAHSIGMTRSVFRNANGLPNPQQVTTARDLVTLGKAIQDRFPRYYSYFSTRSFEYGDAVYRNHNRLLGKIEGVDGIKTGYTVASGFNLLTSAKLDGRHIIAVVLGGRSARARDQQVAELVENHFPRAYAGRRMSAKTIDVAANDEPEAKPAQRIALAAPIADLKPSTMPLPPGRPRVAVIAETGEKQGSDQGLTRGRPLALAASGSTGVMQSATTPLALVGTTPRSPALRWVAGAQPVESPAARPQVRDNRLLPPGSVRYTNGIPDGPIVVEDTQPLPLPVPTVPPVPAPKAELRLTTSPVATQKPEPANETMGQRSAEIIPAPGNSAKVPAPSPKPVTADKTPPAKALTATPPASARTGWVIQLAAAESESKARVILDDAKSKNTGVLKEAEPFTEAVTKGASTLFRARFAGFDADEAQNACKALKRTGFNCFAQKI